MSPDQPDHHPEDADEFGVLPDVPMPDTAVLGILGAATAQVSVSLSLPVDDDELSDDDVVGDEVDFRLDDDLEVIEAEHVDEVESRETATDATAGAIASADERSTWEDAVVVDDAAADAPADEGETTIAIVTGEVESIGDSGGEPGTEVDELVDAEEPVDADEVPVSAADADADEPVDDDGPVDDEADAFARIDAAADEPVDADEADGFARIDAAADEPVDADEADAFARIDAAADEPVDAVDDEFAGSAEAAGDEPVGQPDDEPVVADEPGDAERPVGADGPVDADEPVGAAGADEFARIDAAADEPVSAAGADAFARIDAAVDESVDAVDAVDGAEFAGSAEVAGDEPVVEPDVAVDADDEPAVAAQASGDEPEGDVGDEVEVDLIQTEPAARILPDDAPEHDAAIGGLSEASAGTVPGDTVAAGPELLAPVRLPIRSQASAHAEPGPASQPAEAAAVVAASIAGDTSDSTVEEASMDPTPDAHRRDVERVRRHTPEVSLTSKRIGEFEADKETSDLLTPDRLLEHGRIGRGEPEGAWQHFVYSISGGRINLGDGKRARARKQLTGRIAAPLSGGARFVPVLSRKGGVGKTTVTTLLGMALADARDDRVIAIDANPDRGTLAERIAKPSGRTVRDLVRMKGEVNGYNDVSTVVARDETRLDVLASDADPHVSEAFSDADYEDVAALAAHYYSIVLTDTGTGIVHSVMGSTLGLADQLVIVSGLSIDEARLASETLTWLESNGYAAGVRSAVVVLNNARPGAPLVREDELEAHFATRVRAVVRMPYDPLIATGSAITFRDLQPATRQAARELAATVVEGLRSLAAAA
ncbi:MinD/ParA family ATP-binding protein [Microbacterium luticocti]|uniref:MinD/ParA family ATP-binding protein n=1 Tax=Microbacterium luticocti TaxID=451764 RepID=UPI0004109244|nr:MinD/ParA family protein [Microbacterium luticocti]